MTPTALLTRARGSKMKYLKFRFPARPKSRTENSVGIHISRTSMLLRQIYWVRTKDGSLAIGQS
jgi:hypothetical protein